MPAAVVAAMRNAPNATGPRHIGEITPAAVAALAAPTIARHDQRAADPSLSPDERAEAQHQADWFRRRLAAM